MRQSPVRSRMRQFKASIEKSQANFQLRRLKASSSKLFVRTMLLFYPQQQRTSRRKFKHKRTNYRDTWTSSLLILSREVVQTEMCEGRKLCFVGNIFYNKPLKLTACRKKPLLEYLVMTKASFKSLKCSLSHQYEQKTNCTEIIFSTRL